MHMHAGLMMTTSIIITHMIIMLITTTMDTDWGHVLM